MRAQAKEIIMDSVDTEVLRSAVQWLDAGRRATLATVVKTWGSAPRPVGAMLVIRDDGQVSGSVSGGCVEDDLIARVREHQLSGSTPEVVTYGVTKEEAERFGLPCGGTLKIVLEPLSTDSGMRALLDTVARHELVARTLDMNTGHAVLAPGKWSDVLEFDGATLRTIHGPRWRLLIIGAGQLAHYLAYMARAVDYQVTVCEPREEYALSWNLPDVAIDRGMPDDVVLAMNTDGHTAVEAVTHDPKLDDMALLEALKSPAFYVGAIGSQKNNDARRRRLKQFDLSDDEIARLHGPVGLPIGSRTPPEIAVSILAEMTAVRRGIMLVGARTASSTAETDPFACRM
jgi:xanthine dehydrogenase accessory factor